MASFETTTTHAGNQHRRIRKPLHVDMTPMVDLAFLLITFFMLVSTLHENTAIKLNMPDDSGEPAAIKEGRTLTLIADANDRLWYYQGNHYDQLQPTDYSQDGVRHLVQMSEKKVAQDYPESNGLICIIKTTNDARYDNLVQLLNEMVVNKVPTYAVQELIVQEQEGLKKNK